MRISREHPFEAFIMLLTTTALTMSMASRTANAAFILQFSELETNDNGSLFVDTVAAPGSPVTDADLTAQNTPGAFVFAPGNLPTTLPGYLPRLCGNENGNIGGIAVSTTCRVSLFLALGAVAQADDLKTGIAYLIEPPGSPDAGQVSDSLQVTMIADNNNGQSELDFFWKSDPSAADLLRNCNTQLNETGDYQTIATFSTLAADGRSCGANATFNLPMANLFSVQVQSDVEAVPEPGSLLLFGFALAGLGMSRRRRG